MPDPILQQSQIFAELPEEWHINVLPAIRDMLKQRNQKVVVLDDDPTGTQTVHDTPVLTAWSPGFLRAELLDPASAIFLLTNTRSMTESQAREVNLTIGRNLRTASHQANRPFALISRSDSTLRGHFPLETDALADALTIQPDLIIIAPAFMAGERYTIGNTHYVAEGGALIPVAQTPFANDHTFGYKSSNLRDWIEEKTGGRVAAQNVLAISLEDCRIEGPEQIYQLFMDAPLGTYCVINAVTERDLAVVALAALKAEAAGKHILYRAAASFAAIRAGIDLRPTLTLDSLHLPSAGGGLIVVGSYVPKSTQQLNALLDKANVTAIEVDVRKLIRDNEQKTEIERVAQKANQTLQAGCDAVIYSSRELITAGEAQDDSLSIGNRVSDSLSQIVGLIQIKPRYLLAKGGITASDLVTKALKVRRAIARGQILPGVPLWELDASSRWSDLTYIVFPGNVGDVDALATLVNQLAEKRLR